MTHLAYNLTTGEVLMTTSSSYLKKFVARHTKNDNDWYIAHGYAPLGHKWVFAHGGSYSDCIAKLKARKALG